MNRRRTRRWIGLAIAGVAMVAIVTGARTFLLPWLRGAVERSASRALGRDLKIVGPFDASFSLVPRVVARDVTLANVPGGSEPSMARAGRVTVVLELVSLWSGPARVRELELEDVRLLLEADGEGHGNWQLARDSPPGAPRGAAERPRIDVDRLAIRDLELRYRSRPGAAPVTLEVGELEARLDPATRMLELRGGGSLEQARWEISGRLGTLEKILAGRDLEQALAGRLGESKFEVRGRVREPASLGEPDLELSVEGPDLGAALAHLGVRSALAAAYRLRGRLTPANDGVGVEVEGAVGEVTVGARGVVGALTSFERLDLQLAAAGTDASTMAPWLGVTGLPPRPFDLEGRVRRDAGPLIVDDARVQVGATSLTVAGTLGTWPRFVGADLEVQAEGNDLAELSALTRLRLPSGPFELGGRLLRDAGGLAIDAAELRFGDTLARAAGALGEPPRLLDLALTVESSGPDLSQWSRLVGAELPPRAYAVRGRVARDGSALVLDAVAGRLGDVAVSASGRLAPSRRLEGSDLELRLAGPDLASLLSLAALDEVPADAFDAKGRLRIDQDGYRLDGVEASVGRLVLALDGRIGAPSARQGTSLSGRLDGPALSQLAAWGLPENLPADPFSIAGRIRIDDGVYRAEGVLASVGADRAALDGVLGALPDLSGLDANLDASGPSLAGLERFFAAAGIAEPGRLPGEAYTVSGRVRRTPSGFELRGLRARAGSTTVRVDGTLGTGPDLRGSDLRFDAEGPDTSVLSGLAGTAFPVGPFEAHGQVARVESGWRSDGVTLAIAGARAEVSGTLGPRPGRAGTELRIDVSGPDLAAILGPVTGLAELPAEAFAVSAELAGSAERFASKRFSARLGGNDLEGRLSMRLDGRPYVDADLRSKQLNLAGLLTGFGAEPPPASPPTATAERSRSERERLLSAEPLELGFLRRLDAALRLEAAELSLPGLTLRAVVIAGELREGALRADRIEGTGAQGGRASASFAIEPLGDGYRMRTAGRVDGGRFDVSKTLASPASAPSLDLEFDLQGEGRSLHEIAASGEGQVLVLLGAGQIPHALSDRMQSGVIRGLLEALNPFRESSDHTALECGIAAAELTGGHATVEPIAARTDKMTVTGRGRIDFDTEEIDLSWTLKPRTGVGVTMGSIANPYVELGGTLASPSLDLKPLETVTAMGAAVASAGLTTLSKGIYKRITAEKKVCVEALAKARRQMEPRRGTAAP